MECRKRDIEPFGQVKQTRPEKVKGTPSTMLPLIIISIFIYLLVLVWIIDIALTGSYGSLIDVLKFFAPGIGIYILIKVFDK